MATSTHAPPATEHRRQPQDGERPETSLAGEVGQSLILLALAAVATGAAVGVHALLQALA